MDRIDWETRLEMWTQVVLTIGCGTRAIARMAVGVSRLTHLALRDEPGSQAEGSWRLGG
ncbi:hypothetical protein [Dechloromonas sp. HYN0024]|uniref:hypothetical protein n=1 Tax=Dechloromonas sp. HYN0024 TaxID=2231055 RepID=UPI0013C2B997|nr:hypothetical protein [Dechloromonas sp. HYN0024]